MYRGSSRLPPSLELSIASAISYGAISYGAASGAASGADQILIAAYSGGVL